MLTDQMFNSHKSKFDGINLTEKLTPNNQIVA